MINKFNRTLYKEKSLRDENWKKENEMKSDVKMCRKRKQKTKREKECNNQVTTFEPNEKIIAKTSVIKKFKK